MRPDVLFIDPVCPKPYDRTTLERESLAGTEASAVRVAEALAASRGVVVAQHNRTDSCTSANGVDYVGFETLGALSGTGEPRNVILLRKPKFIGDIRRQFSRSRLFLWLQNVPGASYRQYRRMLRRAEVTVLGVSNYQRNVLEKAFAGVGEQDVIPRRLLRRIPRVRFVYNPIDDGLAPDATSVDPDKLVFFSSPHKGLDEVLLAFEAAHRRRPTLRLSLANPGYRDLSVHEGNGSVTVLGALPQAEVHRHVREAFCVFYPQCSFRESFGLVFAEANALGTPVVTCRIGAAPEVLAESNPIPEATDPESIARFLMSWYETGRPVVRAREAFRLSNVARQWRELLDH